VQLALSTGSLYTYGLNRVFALAKEVGFDGIEVLVDSRWDTRQTDYLQRLRDEYDLPILSLHSPFVQHVAGWDYDQISRVKRTVALADRLGASTVVVHPPLRFHLGVMTTTLANRRLLFPVPIPYARAYARYFTDGSLQALSNSITIAIENMPCKRLGSLRLRLYRLSLDDLARLPHVVLDTTHLGTWGLDVLEVYERLKPNIAHVHLSNFNGKEHRLPWDGHLPLGELLSRLRRDGFSGIVVIESDPEPLEAGSEVKVRANLEATVAFCRRAWVTRP
jgi:sugar phosphate isomerase/epimerase